MNAKTTNANLKSPYIDSSIKYKFFIKNLTNTLLLCFIPLLLLGSLSIYISERYIRADAERNQEKMLNQYDELIRVITSELDSLSLSFNVDPKISDRLASLMSVSNYSLEDLEALYYLKNMIDVPANSKPFIHSVYVYYENNRNRYLSSREGWGNVITSRDTGWYASYRKHSGDSDDIATEVRTIPGNAPDLAPIKVVSLYKFLSVKGSSTHKGVIVVNLLPDYFIKSYQSINELPDRSFCITDENGTVMMQLGSPGDALLRSLNLPKDFDVLDFDKDAYHITIKKTSRLNWHLVSIVPQKSLYSLPYTLVVITCLLSFASLFICGLVALWLTGKHYRQVYGIIHILESADSPDPTEVMPNKVHDIYELIIKNIVESFIEQKYLKVQLSERLYRMQALEFKALQSQINPHFLYNTLNSVYWKTVQLTQSPNVASRMIELLSDILQYALDASKQLVLLEEEMTHVRSYIEIQQIRYKNRFEVVWENFEPYLRMEVLKLSLQPFIENSIQYGVESRSFLRIKVKCSVRNHVLRVTIVDGGPGIAKDRLAQMRAALTAPEEPKSHVGISNTNKRFMLQYGENGKIKLLSKPGWGTVVTLFYPQRPHLEDPALL